MSGFLGSAKQIPKSVRALSDPALPQSSEPLLDIQQVAAWLGVSVKTVYCMRARDDAPPAIQVGRRLRWDRSDVLAWLEAQREVPR